MCGLEIYYLLRAGGEMITEGRCFRGEILKWEESQKEKKIEILGTVCFYFIQKVTILVCRAFTKVLEMFAK